MHLSLSPPQRLIWGFGVGRIRRVKWVQAQENPERLSNGLIHHQLLASAHTTFSGFLLKPHMSLCGGESIWPVSGKPCTPSPGDSGSLEWGCLLIEANSLCGSIHTFVSRTVRIVRGKSLIVPGTLLIIVISDGDTLIVPFNLLGILVQQQINRN